MHLIPLALAGLLISLPLRAQEPVIDTLPLVVRAGLVAPGDSGGVAVETILPDIAFEPGRSYGFVGGMPRSLVGGAAFGGTPEWPLAWREGINKYVFRLPRGEYLLELAFVETEVAWRGHRVFDVIAEDRTIATSLDIADQAGDFAWLGLTARVGVYDGWLDVGFVAHTTAYFPRVSRLRIAKCPDTLELPVAPILQVSSGPLQADLRWSVAPGSLVSAFQILRASSRDGPFEVITPRPRHVPWYVDVGLEAGREYHYQVRSLGLDGGEGPVSNTVTASPGAVGDLGLTTYDLRVLEDDLKKLSVRSESPLEVPAELHSFGDVHQVLLSVDTQGSRWQRKKSFHLVPRIEHNRSIRKRKGIYFAADAGDATLLREKVGAELAHKMGLARPRVEPVALLVNGVSQGLYLDVERLDRRFRLRCQLDRVGILAEETRGDLLGEDWIPYGEQRGEEGNIFGLTELVHELNRLGDGELTRFFEDRFYFDRLVDRFALRLLRGASPTSRYLLEDSRNRRWELFEESEPDGSLGVFDFELEPRATSKESLLEILEGRTVGRGASSRSDPSVLETRLVGLPLFRERLCQRLETFLGGAASASSFNEIVDQAFTSVRKAGLADAWRWPRDGGGSFLAGPERLKSEHRGRIEALQSLLAGLRARAPKRLVLQEILVRPQEGEPWIEIKNLGNASTSLVGCFVTTDVHPRALRFHPPGARSLSPGEVFLWRRSPGGAFPTLDISGGYLALWRQAASGSPPELLDSLFLGRQTQGVAYGREEKGAWAYLATPTPGEINTSRALALPGFELRQGLTREKNGDLRIWLRTRINEEKGEQRPAKVTLFYRDMARADFQSVDLLWDDKSFQYAIQLAAAEDRKRTAYYFLITSPDGLERTYPLPAPRLTFFLPTTAGAKLNEVLPRPTRLPGAPGEFIEIYNPTDAAMDLAGCFLTDSNRNPTRWRIPAGNIVAPRGFAVFFADGANRGNHTSFKLSNSGEFLGLFGRLEEGNLSIDSMAFRGLRTGESWGAGPDGSKSFRSWKDPTPGGRNVPRIPEEYLKRPPGQEDVPRAPFVGEATGDVPVPFTPLPPADGDDDVDDDEDE